MLSANQTTILVLLCLTYAMLSNVMIAVIHHLPTTVAQARAANYHKFSSYQKLLNIKYKTLEKLKIIN
jgi:hypothetical protein